MSPARFPGEHECGVCYGYVHEHQEQCFEGEPWHEYHHHIPPLCCQGCGCGSFEEAHPTAPHFASTTPEEGDRG